MTEKERSESIAFLADKLSKALSRITALERDLKRHIDCKCHNKKEKKVDPVMPLEDPEVCEMCSA
jgi:hypothetical protein